MNEAASQFENQDFMNLETFYESGKGVKTPVWFVQEDNVLWVRTVADSYKVQRLRSTHKANVVPSDRVGGPLGEWVAAQGDEINDEATHKRVNNLLNKKYGLQKKAFDAMGAVQRNKMTTLRIVISDEAPTL